MSNENKYLNYPGLSHYTEKVLETIDQKIDEQAVKYNEAQTLTENQKAQARTNIGAGSGEGSVTSVGIENASQGGISVSGSPITSSGTITIGLETGYGDIKNPFGNKTAHTVLAAPIDSNGVPSFRALTSADISDLSTYYIPKNLLTSKGDIIYASASGIPSILSASSDGKFLTLSNGAPVWGDSVSANDGVLTLKAGNNVRTFSANQATNETFEITAADLGITGPMEFIGTSTTDPSVSGATVSGHTTWKKGEVVIYKPTGENGYKEYINLDGNNTGASWEIFGDADSYALNSTTIEGVGALSGGGDLSSNRIITHNEILGTPETVAKVFKTTLDKYGHVSSATAATAADVGVSLTTTSGSESISVDGQSLLFGSNAFNSTPIPTDYTKSVNNILPDANGNITLAIPTGFNITANAADGLFDITGTGGTNEVSYSFAPYSAKQTNASFYSGATNPDLTTRLNYDGYLYATKLYSNGKEVAAAEDIPVVPTLSLIDQAAGSGTGAYQETEWIIGSDSVEFDSITSAEISSLF